MPIAINYNSHLPTCPRDTGGPYTLIVSVWEAVATVLVAVQLYSPPSLPWVCTVLYCTGLYCTLYLVCTLEMLR